MPSKYVSEVLSLFIKSHPNIRCVFNRLNGRTDDINILYKNYYPESSDSVIFELSNDKKISCNDLEFCFIKNNEVQLGNYSFYLE
jgi:hypothetical protein